MCFKEKIQERVEKQISLQQTIQVQCYLYTQALQAIVINQFHRVLSSIQLSNLQLSSNYPITVSKSPWLNCCGSNGSLVLNNTKSLKYVLCVKDSISAQSVRLKKEGESREKMGIYTRVFLYYLTLQFRIFGSQILRKMRLEQMGKRLAQQVTNFPQVLTLSLDKVESILFLTST